MKKRMNRRKVLIILAVIVLGIKVIQMLCYPEISIKYKIILSIVLYIQMFLIIIYDLKNGNKMEYMVDICVTFILLKDDCMDLNLISYKIYHYGNVIVLLLVLYLLYQKKRKK